MKSPYLLKFDSKIKRNLLEVILEKTYGPQLSKYFKLINLKLGRRRLVTNHFVLHSDLRGVDDIKHIPILINFCI